MAVEKGGGWEQTERGDGRGWDVVQRGGVREALRESRRRGRKRSEIKVYESIWTE